MLKNINVSNLNINKNIIDIRSKEKYNTSHITNSKNVEFNNLFINPSKYLKKSETYYIYCQHGKQSVKLCIMLTKLGYNVVNILGGYEAWLLK